MIMAKRSILVHDSLPCEHAQVVLGMAWLPLPRDWQTRRRDCDGCGAGFTITAREQKFWYEELKIPFHVEINRCPTCRRMKRTTKRIMAELSTLLPVIERKAATPAQMKTAVLAIVEGMQSEIRYPWIGAKPLLSTRQIAQKGIRLIGQLMKEDMRHADLLPLLSFLHHHLGQVKKLEKIEQQRAAVHVDGKASSRRMRLIEVWLRSSTKLGREQISHN
jgi:hypothetical protein